MTQLRLVHRQGLLLRPHPTAERHLVVMMSTCLGGRSRGVAPMEIMHHCDRVLFAKSAGLLHHKSKPNLPTKN